MTRKKVSQFLTSGIAVLALSACALTDSYESPTPNVDVAWDQTDDVAKINQEAVKPAALAGIDKDAPWWERWRDPVLVKLITKALERNYDLKIAAARIEEAEANELGTFSDFFPRPEITGEGKRGTIGGTYKNRLDKSWQSGVSGTWDIDLFGGNYLRDEAGNALIEASKAEEAQTRLKLIEEVARNYIRLRGLQQQKLLTERNIALQQQTVVVTNAQFTERVVTKLDVLRAEAQMNRTQSRIPQIQHEINVVLNRLAVLLDDHVGSLRAMMPPEKLPVLSGSILPKTPIETMQARPDIRIAERRLAQATHLTRAAFTDFFPKISLSGFFGRSDSKQFSYQSPWSAAVNGALPVLNWGRLVSEYHVADARQKQALYGFQQTVLAAVEDTQVAYSAFQHERSRKQMLDKIAGEQAQAVEVARVQYKNGLVPQLDLLDAQQNLLDAQTGVVQSEETVLENAVGLYTALAQSEKKAADEEVSAERASAEKLNDNNPANDGNTTTSAAPVPEVESH